MEKGTLASLRRYFITGLVVIAPVGVTVFILVWIFDRIDAILGRVFGTFIGYRIPGVGLLALVLLLIGVGWVAQQAVGGRLISMTKNWLSTFPVTRGIYSAASQIVESLVVDKEKFFKACVLAEYPRAGSWALGFVTSDAPGEISAAVGEELIAVFVPTAPNPTSGVLVFLPHAKVRRLRMSVEEAFKLVLSGGVVLPEQLEGMQHAVDESA
jgi:uncharacterized membrane protein